MRLGKPQTSSSTSGPNTKRERGGGPLRKKNFYAAKCIFLAFFVRFAHIKLAKNCGLEAANKKKYLQILTMDVDGEITRFARIERHGKLFD